MWQGLARAQQQSAGRTMQPQPAAVQASEPVPQENLDPNENPAYYRAGPFLEGYSFNELPLDPESLFYPSSATTRSGDYYSEAKLLDVERCGDAGCHPDIYDQWYESTHHLASFNDPWYRRTFQFFEERSGRLPSQWCAGCHDPAVMMTGVSGVIAAMRSHSTKPVRSPRSWPVMTRSKSS